MTLLKQHLPFFVSIALRLETEEILKVSLEIPYIFIIYNFEPMRERSLLYLTIKPYFKDQIKPRIRPKNTPIPRTLLLITKQKRPNPSFPIHPFIFSPKPPSTKKNASTRPCRLLQPHPVIQTQPTFPNQPSATHPRHITTSPPSISSFAQPAPLPATCSKPA